MSPYRDRHRVELQHLDARDQPAQVRTGDSALRSRLTKPLGRNGYPPRVGGSQPNEPGHGPENISLGLT
jgi:hypothetical protein